MERLLTDVIRSVVMEIFSSLIENRTWIGCVTGRRFSPLNNRKVSVVKNDNNEHLINELSYHIDHQKNSLNGIPFKSLCSFLSPPLRQRSERNTVSRQRKQRQMNTKFLSSGERFGNDEELKMSVIRWFHSQAAEFYGRGIQKLTPRYDKCLNSDGGYVEK
ncbi:hypothetical protein ANN_09132 [Periplaneta americana]|uniref:Uncharacterized protein n=1 Tax=Periplaneta americana TaxID=6978 RepID=A0ABQ8TKI6_PERAM|nr:hypothetical protein ANN_09132 [Periplaneta americana]